MFSEHTLYFSTKKDAESQIICVMKYDQKEKLTIITNII